MEFWSISSDGNGNYVIYPTYIIGAGALIAAVLAIIKTIINGSADKIYNFANNNTWIVMIVIAVISIAISVCLGIFLGKKAIHLVIFFGISLTVSLSLCYSEIIYWVGGLAEQLEKVFLVALFMSPVFFIFMLLQMAITLILSVIAFVPMLFKISEKYRCVFSTILVIVVTAILVYLFFNSQLPIYILHS